MAAVEASMVKPQAGHQSSFNPWYILQCLKQSRVYNAASNFIQSVIEKLLKSTVNSNSIILQHVPIVVGGGIMCLGYGIGYIVSKKGQEDHPRDGDPEDDDWLRAQRNEARKEQVKVEKEEAFEAIQRTLSYSTPFRHCQDMGSRLQKHWYWSWAVVSIAPLSRNCSLNLKDKKTLRNLNAVVRELKHPHLLPVLGVGYEQDSEQVIVTQLGQGASLRDLVYQERDPTLDWADKYQPSAETRPLPAAAVAAYGRQILTAVVYLYKQGFPQLQHIQMGNIFVNTMRDGGNLSLLPHNMAARAEREEPEGEESDHEETGEVASAERVNKVEGTNSEAGWKKGEEPSQKEGVVEDVNLHCCLGGYENTLLGYRSRLFKSIAQAELQHRIDVIMFGHVIYELLTGQELQRVCPEEEQYQVVEDEEARNVLRKIFDLDADPTIEEILSWDFFAKAEPSRQLLKGVKEGAELSSDLRSFLKATYGEGSHGKGGKKGKHIGKASSWLTGLIRRK